MRDTNCIHIINNNISLNIFATYSLINEKTYSMYNYFMNDFL